MKAANRRYARRMMLENPEKIRARNRQWHRDNPERSRASRLKCVYGYEGAVPDACQVQAPIRAVSYTKSTGHFYVYNTDSNGEWTGLAAAGTETIEFDVFGDSAADVELL